VRALQKLTRNGNSTMVTIPRAVLIHLDWLPGEAVILEVLEDKSIRLRRPRDGDFAPVRMPRVTLDDADTVKA
jgi:antitoxin component of MazEF toxin-antitoxin module